MPCSLSPCQLLWNYFAQSYTTEPVYLRPNSHAYIIIKNVNKVPFPFIYLLNISTPIPTSFYWTPIIVFTEHSPPGNSHQSSQSILQQYRTVDICYVVISDNEFSSLFPFPFKDISTLTSTQPLQRSSQILILEFTLIGNPIYL